MNSINHARAPTSHTPVHRTRHHNKLGWIMLVTAAVLVGCPKPAFDLTSGADVTVKQGESTTTQVNISYKDYTGPISFATPSNLPTGVTATIEQVSRGAAKATVTFTATSDATVGDATVKIEGTGVGAEVPTKEIQLKLAVTAKTVTPVQPSIAVSPTLQVVNAGSAGIPFTANLQNSTTAITWSLSGVGSLSGTTGPSVTYTPPATVAATSSATLTAQAGSVSTTATITVNPVGSPAAPSITSFTATPPNLPVGGGDVTLNWAQTGATTLSIDQGVGTVTGTSKVVNVTSTKTFILTATNGAGSVNSSVTVTVAIPPANATWDSGTWDSGIWGP
jgi:hypothetical protein